MSVVPKTVPSVATLKVLAGQASEAGVKERNDDSCGIRIPDEPLLTTKGIAAVIADGVSGSEGGREAAEAGVLGFLSDYYSTPDCWSVKKSATKVLGTLNSWMYGQGQRRFGSSRGMVTTFSALVIKSATAHLFHVGDTRISRLRGKDFECLTRDHRAMVRGEAAHLSRAMGLDLHLVLDYRALPVEPGDLFVLSTDGVHDAVSISDLTALLQTDADPELVVRTVIERARANGSRDNLTCQLIRVERLALQNKEDLYQRLTELPFPPPLSPGMTLDGYRILRELAASKRSQIYLAEDTAGGDQVVLKTPSVNFEDDPGYIERFLQEEWAGRRLNSPHVLKVHEVGRRRFLYLVTEYADGQTLRQWIRDHPNPPLSEVRAIVEQLAVGLREFHRMEMIHQDLKPENILIDGHGTVKIIDFGSCKIAGIEEIAVPWERGAIQGTLNYTAPECFGGAAGTDRSDLFSLGVIVYELLTGALPYEGKLVPNAESRATYVSARRRRPELPVWIDAALEKAVRKDPQGRYIAISNFVRDLSVPNPDFLRRGIVPLLERNPVGFWRGVSIALFILSAVLIYLVLRS